VGHACEPGGARRPPETLPGEYYLAALTDFDRNDVDKAWFLEQVAAAATKITIGEGEKKTQDLKIASGGSVTQGFSVLTRKFTR